MGINKKCNSFAPFLSQSVVDLQSLSSLVSAADLGPVMDVKDPLMKEIRRFKFREKIIRDFRVNLGRLCISKLTIIGSDNGLAPNRRQAIIWTNAATLSIRP